MALQWIDNFQQYGTSTGNMLNGAYAQIYTSSGGGVVLTSDPDPTAGGTTVLEVLDSAEISTGGAAPWGSGVRKVVPTPAATIGVMWRWWLAALPTDTTHHPQVVFTDGSNNTQISLVVSPIGTIKVYRGLANGGTLLGESSIAVVANAWQHFEAKVVIGASGSVEVRVDTNSVILLTGVNTQGGSTTTANIVLANGNIGGTNNGAISYFKDFVIWDSTGVYNNSFIGSCFVWSMRPNADVSGTWSIFGGAGSGWASINETNPDDDTKYVYSGWPAATADVFGLTDLPADATSVKGMMSLVRSKKSDGGDGNLQVGIVSGASTGTGSNRPITVAYTYWSDIFETDPATGVQWTVAAANAADLKLDRTL
jgi:hypothetical protein